MRIGITYDLKTDLPASADLPDDFQEEFDSPGTIEAIAAELRELGHEPIKLGDGAAMLQRLLDDPPDFVFNFAEGQGVGRSREARVPAVLEMLGIPYTGSDPLALGATLDKDFARRLVQSAHVRIPDGSVIAPGESLKNINSRADLRYPFIVKPAWEGSSKGIRSKCLADSLKELTAAIRFIWREHRQPALMEEYIAGDELTVGILGNNPPKVMGVMRVVPRTASDRFIYSLEIKRDFRRQVRYEVPAELPAHEFESVENDALTVFKVLGCRDVARIDFRLRDGVPYFLEVNPLPGLNPESSDLVIMAHGMGWSYRRLIGAILEAALARFGAPNIWRAEGR